MLLNKETKPHSVYFAKLEVLTIKSTSDDGKIFSDVFICLMFLYFYREGLITTDTAHRNVSFVLFSFFLSFFLSLATFFLSLLTFFYQGSFSLSLFLTFSIHSFYLPPLLSQSFVWFVFSCLPSFLPSFLPWFFCFPHPLTSFFSSFLPSFSPSFVFLFIPFSLQTSVILKSIGLSI